MPWPVAVGVLELGANVQSVGRVNEVSVLVAVGTIECTVVGVVSAVVARTVDEAELELGVARVASVVAVEAEGRLPVVPAVKAMELDSVTPARALVVFVFEPVELLEVTEVPTGVDVGLACEVVAADVVLPADPVITGEVCELALPVGVLVGTVF